MQEFTLYISLYAAPSAFGTKLCGDERLKQDYLSYALKPLIYVQPFDFFPWKYQLNQGDVFYVGLPFVLL